MSASVDWHPKLKDSLLMKIEGDITAPEVIAVSERESEMIIGAGRVVHTLIDAQRAGKIPPNFVTLMPRIASMPAAKHPNAGLKVVVGITGVAGSLLNVFSKLYHKIYFFPEMREAEEFLARKESSNA